VSVQAQTGYVDLGDGKLYYGTAGAGDTLVLLHAGFVDSGMWDEQWREFAQHFRVVRFDARGFGKSDPAQGPVSRRDELYRLLRELDIERAHLLGCSMGGATIIDFALEHPDMVSALIPASAAPGGFEPKGEPPRYLQEMMSAVQHGDLTRASELQIRIWVDGPSREPVQVNPRVRQHAAEMNRPTLANGTWVKADSQPLNPLDPPAVGRLKDLHVPTLIIAGALDDPEILRAAEVMTVEISGAQKVIIPGGAHVHNMENPSAFNRAVLDFLAGIG
jgi:pimeloyl-ACP methyl ester carboxylesterase